MMKGKKVAVIEDDKSILSLIEETLSYEGYEVVTAENGHSGLSLINKTGPDLILLDIILPRLDGIKVCRKLKDNSETQNIPIIIISGETKKEMIVELLKIGVRHFLAKPFKMEDLLKRVNAILDPMKNINKLSHLKMRYYIQEESVLLHLLGELTQEDIPILNQDIEQHLTDRISKIIIDISELSSLSHKEISILEEIRNYFSAKNIMMRITAGDPHSLRSDLLLHSTLKENVIFH